MPPSTVNRQEVQRLIDHDDATLVEVLPRPEYDWAHLTGATNLPVKRWDVRQVRARLDPSRPVIVYCHDST